MTARQSSQANVMRSGGAVFLAAMMSACRPRKRLTVAEWADAHRILTSKASSEAGPWRTSRAPFLREIMDCLSSNSPIRSVSIMKAAQLGGTEIALNWIGYVMDHAPAPMLVVVPTLDVRERWTRQRLDPLLTQTERLCQLFDVKRKRASSNTEGIKDYPGGMLILGGANSPASLASMPIKYSVNDEIDRFPWEVGAEGDPLELIRARQRTFPRRKELNISTPTVRGASRIEGLFDLGDQRQYHVPCPHCHELLVLHWSLDPEAPQHGRLQWTIDKDTQSLHDVSYLCGHCGQGIKESHKTWMLKNGQWIAKYPHRSDTTRSYHISGLYAPIGLGLRWKEMVEQWLAAQRDKTRLQVFVNTILGEVWEDRDDTLSERALAERAEPYGLRDIPPGCVVLTCGIDVQGDRIELQVLGHGRGRRTWTIDYVVLPGDPARLLSDAARGEGALIDYLVAPFAAPSGRELRIEATAIDTGGHHTQDTYDFVRSVRELPIDRRPRRVMAVKGANAPGRAILAGRPRPQDVNRHGRVIKHGVLLWMLGTDTGKSLLFSRLRGDTGQDVDARLVHFSSALPQEFFVGLISERFDFHLNRWVRMRNRRNEPLDTWVYATAAAYHPEIRIHAKSQRDWDYLEQMVGQAKDRSQEQSPEQSPVISRRPLVRRVGTIRMPA